MATKRINCATAYTGNCSQLSLQYVYEKPVINLYQPRRKPETATEENPTYDLTRIFCAKEMMFREKNYIFV